MVQKYLVLVVLVATIVSAAATTFAQTSNASADIEELKARLNDLKAQIDALQMKQGTVAREQLKKEIMAELKDDNLDLKLKELLKGLTFSGDLRLRYEGIWPDTKTGTNRTKARHRGRFRLRFGLEKELLDDQMRFGFRLASGTGTATSTNQTMTGAFGQKALWIDRAYAIIQPKGLKGVTIVGGKVKNPLPVSPSGMVWDSDVTPEGIWGEYRLKTAGDVEPFVSAGHFVLTETATGGHDVTMTSFGSGLKVKTSENTSVEGAARYLGYDFHGAGGVAAAARTAGTRNWGVVNIGGKVNTKVGGIVVEPFAEWAHNLVNDDSRARTRDADHAYAAGVKVGSNKMKGDLSAKYQYKYMEMNSTPGAVSDADFGGPNRKGHVLGLVYSLTDSVTLGATALYTSPIVGVAPADSKNRSTTIQIEMIWSF